MKQIGEVRVLTNDDRAAVVQLAARLPEWFTPDGVHELEIDLGFQHSLGVFSSEDGALLGFLMYYVQNAIGHIGWMGVDPGCHRQGIGSALLGAFTEIMLTSGIAEIRVMTLSDSVEYPPYEQTRSFYYRNGFSVLERRWRGTESCPEELHLTKSLRTPHAEQQASI